jgi:hypothetical protein
MHEPSQVGHLLICHSGGSVKSAPVLAGTVKCLLIKSYYIQKIWLQRKEHVCQLHNWHVINVIQCDDCEPIFQDTMDIMHTVLPSTTVIYGHNASFPQKK